MQPFDALTIRAVLHEARPLLHNRKVDKVYQLARDEIILCLRAKSGMLNLLLSAHNKYGRIGLVKVPSANDSTEKSRVANASNFSLQLKRHLTGGTLIGIEQPTGERMVDFAFSCTDEVGTTSIKIISIEIMGRHSNIIFWDKATEKILSSSHTVTKDMSRTREVAPGLRFVRPPSPDKCSIFEITEEDYNQKADQLIALVTAGQTPPAVPSTIEQWLINSFTGLGRNLAEELIASIQMPSLVQEAISAVEFKSTLWQQISRLQKIDTFKPAMKKDYSRYTVLSWWPHMQETAWRPFNTSNDLVVEYYRAAEEDEQFHHLKERLRAELKGEVERLQNRINSANEHIVKDEELQEFKTSGDLILANIDSISIGQEDFTCENLFGENGDTITITLNPNLNASQNAQTFYRLYAKGRARRSAASAASVEANTRMDYIRKQQEFVEGSKASADLFLLKESFFGNKPTESARAHNNNGNNSNRPKPKSKMLSMTSSDGWTVYVGRNKEENDHLLGRLAQPNDLWFHNLGSGGAHVLIRVPASKQEPPLTTIHEAAQVAARFSKAASSSKVRVVYTQCKHVKKIGKDNPGQVRYEHERTLEVDTSTPMPKCMKQLFST